MLPAHNIPAVKQAGVKQLDPTDAAQNFGTFVPGEAEDAGLEVCDCAYVLGHNGESLGLGVFTKV